MSNILNASTLNILYHALHWLVIALNLFGWTIPRLRRLTFIMQMLTLSSWAGFGIWKGWWGYCPLTDWHWQIKRLMGEMQLPSNYLSYVANNWFALDLSSDFLRGVIFGSFALAFFVSLYIASKRTG